MSKRLYILLVLGIVMLISGVFFRDFLGIPKVLAIILGGIGGGTISATIMYDLIKRGNLTVRDEMVMRIENLSGKYTTIFTMRFIVVLSIVNVFHHMSAFDVLLIMMIFISSSYFITRYYLLKWGKTE